MLESSEKWLMWIESKWLQMRCHLMLSRFWRKKKSPKMFFAQFWLWPAISRCGIVIGECKCCTMKVKFAQGINKIFISKAFLSVAMLLSQKSQIRDRCFRNINKQVDFCMDFTFFPFGFSVSVRTLISAPFCTHLRQLTHTSSHNTLEFIRKSLFQHCITLHLCLIWPKNMIIA